MGAQSCVWANVVCWNHWCAGYEPALSICLITLIREKRSMIFHWKLLQMERGFFSCLFCGLWCWSKGSLTLLITQHQWVSSQEDVTLQILLHTPLSPPRVMKALSLNAYFPLGCTKKYSASKYLCFSTLSFASCGEDLLEIRNQILVHGPVVSKNHCCGIAWFS